MLTLACHSQLPSLPSALATVPPFFGFASALTFCGFTYGLWPGIPIAFAFTLAGSSLSFGVYRFLLKDQFRGMMGNKSGRGREGGKYEAFQAVVVSRARLPSSWPRVQSANCPDLTGFRTEEQEPRPADRTAMVPAALRAQQRLVCGACYGPLCGSSAAVGR